jgi:CRP-like cAMP-binding protein
VHLVRWEPSRLVAKALAVHEAAPDVMLVRQGESGDTFYVLLEGEAKVVRNGSQYSTAEAYVYDKDGALVWAGKVAATLSILTAAFSAANMAVPGDAVTPRRIACSGASAARHASHSHLLDANLSTVR